MESTQSPQGGAPEWVPEALMSAQTSSINPQPSKPSQGESLSACLHPGVGGWDGDSGWEGAGGLPGWMHSTLYGVSGKVGAELSERIEVILPRTINSCNLHLNELDSLNLALLKWVKGHGTPIISIISWGSSPSWW